MGISILELVLQRLREAGFLADAAYPGQAFPQIGQTVAAVHIEKVDRTNLTVTVEVVIISPAAMGGTACEMEALRAVEALCRAGAECVQNGCRYDGTGKVYTVSVSAKFICSTGADDCTLGPGFQVYIGDNRMNYAVSFIGEKQTEHRMQYGIGENAPVNVDMGPWVWQLTLEELIPVGDEEPEQMKDGVSLVLVRTGKKESFHGCRWDSVKRVYTRQGLRRIHSGFALLREEEAIG